MSYEIIATKKFRSSLKQLRKRYHSIDEDFERLVGELERQPILGIALGRGCYKIRMRIAAKNIGKSGGARVITCVRIINQQVFLLAIYDKLEQESISDNERDELLRGSGLL